MHHAEALNVTRLLVPVPDNRVRRLRQLSLAVSMLMVGGGACVLISRTLDFPWRAGPSPWLTSMNANTALAFLCLGSALVLLRAPALNVLRRVLGAILAGFVTLLALLTLCEYASGLELVSDRLPFQHAGATSGRMAVTSALIFVVLGVGVCLLDVERKSWSIRWAQRAALVAGLFGIWVVAGNLIGTRAVWSHESFALYPALAFLLASLGLLFARPDQGVTALVASSTTAGSLMRRLIPVGIVVPLALGWLWSRWPQVGSYGAEVSLAVSALFTVLGVSLTVHWASRSLLRLERAHAVTTRALADNERRLTSILGCLSEAASARPLEPSEKLAGGIAHDFNNILTIVLGYCDVLLHGLAQHDTGRSELIEIKQAAERAAELTRQLIAFSRKQLLAPRIIDLGEIVRRMDHFVRRNVGDNISVTTNLPPGLWKVEVDPDHFEQIVTSLFVSARDAMPRGGSLTIGLENVELNEHADDRAGPHVMLRVTDSAPALDPDTLMHVFDPFFTREPGKRGAGLGLAAMLGTVRQSGGHVAIESTAGKGTTFSVYFPRVSGPVAKPPECRASEPPPHVERKTVLLVDDDAPVRVVTRQLLERQG